MFKDVLSAANLTHFATWGLVIFVAVFVAVTLWVFTRSRRQVKDWSALPLDDRPDDPVREPRRPAPSTDPKPRP